jgi:hypothetical protein
MTDGCYKRVSIVAIYGAPVHYPIWLAHSDAKKHDEGWGYIVRHQNLEH